MQKLIITSVALLAITGILIGMNSDNIQSNLTKNFGSPATVPYVDLDRYVGMWYQQASIPAFYQKGCTHTTALYSWNTGKKSIQVNNTCIRNGKLGGGITTAFVQDETHAKLRVQWIEGFKFLTGAYWIVRLGKDYQYAVVSSPDYSNLWILSRQKIMANDQFNAIVQDLRKDNFYVEKLVRTDQS